MNEDRWRVVKLGEQAWCVWPPGWRLIAPPMMAFKSWRAAYTAAYNRAWFRNSPPPPQVKPMRGLGNGSEVSGKP